MGDVDMLDEMRNSLKSRSQQLDDEMQKLGWKTKHHEENVKRLEREMENIDETILDIQVGLGNYYSTVDEGESNSSIAQTAHHIEQCIKEQNKSAAGIICQMKSPHRPLGSRLPLISDVLGVVALLGKVNNDNLSRLLSEFVGSETMLGLVCKTHEGVKALEKYDREGTIDKIAGLHGLGPSIGRRIDGRYSVFCLELMRPYAGGFLEEDSQKKLALMKPKLLNGECPPGFLGFAVNMINVDHMHLSCLTAGGYGLRETLFYRLFSRLQVYNTRAQMQLAVPFISDGAISLDGGMIKADGLFFLGDRNDFDIRFPVSTGTSILPAHVADSEEKLKLLKWKKEMLLEDIKRENRVLITVRELFDIKRQAYLECHEQATTCFTQGQASGNGRI